MPRHQPRYRQAGGMPFKPRRPAEPRYADLSTEPVPPEPHPQLKAETRTLHLWLVESSVCFHGADADAISEAVYLPLDIVARHLFTLGLGPDPRAPRPKPTRPNWASTGGTR